jgi:hypothetical protein
MVIGVNILRDFLSQIDSDLQTAIHAELSELKRDANHHLASA